VSITVHALAYAFIDVLCIMLLLFYACCVHFCVYICEKQYVEG